MNWDRVERLFGKENLARLAAAKVGIIGLGSGGGFVAVSLAMTGVGHFVLVDSDNLEPSNIVRHVADRRYLGVPKVEAVADLIHQRNPDAQVTTYVGRIEQHPEAFDGLDLLVVGVDGENAKYVINQACLQRRLTAIYAGVYERGEGGDVVVIRPYDGPCYACWAEQLREGMTAAPVEALDYGMIGPEGTLEAEPGLWLHVVRVATAQTTLALNELMRDTSAHKPMPANTLMMANDALEILEGSPSQPQSALWVPIERNPDCLVCGDAARLAAGVGGAAAAVSLDDLGVSVEGDGDG